MAGRTPVGALLLVGLFLQLGLARAAVEGGWAAARGPRSGWGRVALVLGGLAAALQAVLILALLVGVPALFG